MALLGSDKGNPDDLSTLPHGFELDEADPPQRLALRGENRFTRFALTFVLDEVDARHTRLTADSNAAFHGMVGKLYRALVIGTGAHGLVVRWMLRGIANKAEKSPAAIGGSQGGAV